MHRTKKIYPLATSFILLAALAFILWSYHKASASLHTTKNETEFLLLTFGGNVLPFVLLLLLLAAVSWRNYLQQKKTLETWHRSSRTLARIILDLEAHDITYLTIPEHRRPTRLKKVYDDLNKTCLKLHQEQKTIEHIQVGSYSFKDKVHTFASEVEALDALAQTHMASGNYYGPVEDIHTIFDILIRPLDLRAREILFFLEDIPQHPLPEQLLHHFRVSFEELRALTQESRKYQAADLNLDRLLTLWQVAETSLAQAAHKIIAECSAPTPKPQKGVASSPEEQQTQKVSLTLLREVLGLPVSGRGVAEPYLEEAARLAYLKADQSWRPVSQRLGQSRPMNFVEAIRVNSYLASTDELVFKARALSARLDARYLTPVRRKFWGSLSSSVLGLAFALTSVLTLLLIAASFQSSFSDTEIKALGGFFLFRYTVSLFITVNLILLSPLLLFFLLRTVLLYLVTGSYLRRGHKSRRIRAAKQRFAQLTTELEETELNLLALQDPQHQQYFTSKYRHLSAELLHQSIAYIHKDISYYETLSQSQKADTLGETLLLEIERSIGLLAEEYQDIKDSYLSSLKR